ncbi:MAG: hypothetical protein NT131_08325 [Methanomassiliicoccales archaeon]|nr:hypothetical protein [Methanomassiliicoccales archaeon]
MLFSTIAGVLILAIPQAGEALSPSVDTDGNVFIGQDFDNATWLIQGTVNLNGNLTIRAGGTVTIDNGTLNFLSYYGSISPRIHTLIIEDGGQIILINSAITAEDKLFNVSYALGMLVRNGGSLMAENSFLQFNGKILVDDATFEADGTLIDGPLFTAMSSDVELYDSSMTNIPGMPETVNTTYPYSFATSYNHTVAVDYLFERNADDTKITVPTGQVATDLTMNDAGYVELANAESLTVSGFDIGGLTFDKGQAISVALKAEYRTADDFKDGGSPNSFYYYEYLDPTPNATSMAVVQSYENFDPPGTNHDVILTQDLTSITLSSLDLSVLSVTLTNTKAQSVFIDRIWVEVGLEIDAYNNVTIAGTSELTAVNTAFGVNYLNYALPEYRKLVVTDLAQANLYGVSVEGEFVANGTGPFVTVQKDLTFKPLEQGADDNTTETNVADLLTSDNHQYYVTGGKKLHIQPFNVADLSGAISSLSLTVEYACDVGYTNDDYIQWNVTGTPLTNANILITSETEEILVANIQSDNVTSISDLASISIVYDNLDTLLVAFDNIYLKAVTDPTINVYRWVDVSVRDSNNLPVKGAVVNATGSLTNQAAVYYFNDSVSQVPPQGVLDYLGRNSTDYKTTNDSGMVLLPLLTDTINVYWAPNSYPAENYRMAVTYVNESAVAYTPAAKYTSFEAYPDLTTQSVAFDFVIDNLVLRLPDLTAINFATDPTTIYQGDAVELNFTVINYGLTTASEFVVSVKDAIGNQTHYLDNITVTNLSPGESRNIVVDWGSSLTTAGTHSIIITVDARGQVLESIETNNVLSPSVKVLEFLPDLAVDGPSIVFSQNPGYANQVMSINVTVSNLDGKKAAIGAVVSFFIGNPTGGGQYLGSASIDAPAGGSNVTSFAWTPTQIGTYSIFVWVNEGNSIKEYSYANNIASSSLEVILVAQTGDWVVTDEYEMSLASLTWQHNIIIEGNGYLAFLGTNVLMEQASNPNITQIVVRDNGTLVLNGASLDSDSRFKVYLFDNGRLFVNESTLMPNIDVMMGDSSIIYMENSRVRGVMRAPETSSVTLTTFNTTFDYALSDFGGTSVARLTASTIGGVAPVSPKDSAIIYLYSWIVTEVYDGTGEHTIPGTYVDVKAFPATPYTSGITDENGTLRIQALSAVVTTSGPQLSGNYVLNATYWYNGTAYESDVDGAAQVLYYPTKIMIRSDAYVRLDISSAKPDIDPPFTVSTNETLRGSDVSLSTVINNIGVVTAFNILVRFEDNSTTGTVLIEDYLVEELAPLSNITITVTWTATYPLGLHNLSVTVDPLNQIPELNEDNNANSSLVTVLGVPDMSITVEDITIDPAESARDRTSSITAAVTNLGDFTASAFNVSFYDSVEGFIGTAQISNVPTGEKGVASVSWTPTVAGIRTITVNVDEENVIVEGSEANNIATITVDVLDYPDLVGVSVSFLINGIAGDEANLNDEVSIVAAVFNNGESAAIGFNVVFWLNGESIIGSVHVATLAKDTSTTVTLLWDPVLSGGEQYQNVTILAVVNPDTNATYTHVLETDDPLNSNNNAFQVLQIIDNRPNLALIGTRILSTGEDVTSGVLGETIHIAFNVRNLGIVEASNVHVNVYLNATEDIVLLDETKNIGRGATVSYNVSWTVNIPSGDYQLIVDIGAGQDADPSDNMFESNFTVAVLDPDIYINLGGKTDFAPGDAIFVNGQVTQSTNGAPLSGLLVRVTLTDSGGFPLTTVFNVTTDDDGNFFAYITTPSGREGSQRVTATLVTSEGNFTENANINIVAPFTPESIPFWVYLLIIVIVIAVIIIFSLYLYRVGLGKMVECGNCGALIPEASKHCPKCGVEFEPDTAKCSECGAWIPSKAESCPECGAKFMTEPVEQGQVTGYIEAMRKQYDEYIDGFRNQAKTALGSKYSEEKFQEWLQTEPEYLPFEEWLRKEEMSKKTGVFPCPTCGTLNARDSKVCHRCGTVFDEKTVEEAEAKPDEKKSPFRRVVKRSNGKEAPKEEKPSEQPPAEGENKNE